MNVSMQKITVALVLAGLLIGCAPADAPSQPGQALAPAPVGAPGPTRVYDVPPPPSPTPQTVVLAQTAEPATEPTDSPVAPSPSLWSGSLTILHTNDSVGYLDPCG
jgi:hypothetical protein